MKNLLNCQEKLLSYFYERIDATRAEEIVDLCAQAKGLLVFTGVGKSGLIAEKIVMTLISTGTRALYLPTINFLHGDIGVLSENDIVFMLSKSGETEELVHLIPFIRKRGARIVSWVSNAQSRLARQADLSIELPVEKELCPFDLVPTISAEVQLLFGDMLAVALMKRQNFSLVSYSENHPAGMIGKKASVTVKDVMIAIDKLAVCLPSDTIQEILPAFSEKRVGCVVVADGEGTFQGIFTDGDLRRALQSQGSSIMGKSLNELMTKSAFVTKPEEMAWEAMKQMQKDPNRWVMMLPVLQEGRIVGLVRMHDIIHAGIT